MSVLATLLELAGIPVPSGLDGESLAPDLREPQRTRDTTIYSEYALGSPHAKAMIRHGDFKYNYYTNDLPELYNLREDPEEMHNLAILPANKAQMEDLQHRLFTWHKPA